MKNGFTLVEILISITILAILITTGFFMMSGYSSSARNTVRTYDVGNIQTIIENEKNQGIGIMAFTKGGQELSDASIGGTGAIVDADYKAGDISPSVLKIVSPDFEDPNGEIYKLGVTTRHKGEYELGSIMEEGGQEVANIKGIYKPRTIRGVEGVGQIGTQIFSLSYPEDANAFFMYDFVTGTGVPTDTQLDRVSSDGMTLTLSKKLTENITSLSLVSEETPGLIKGEASTDPVIDGTDILPY